MGKGYEEGKTDISLTRKSGALLIIPLIVGIGSTGTKEGREGGRERGKKKTGWEIRKAEGD